MYKYYNYYTSSRSSANKISMMMKRSSFTSFHLTWCGDICIQYVIIIKYIRIYLFITWTFWGKKSRRTRQVVKDHEVGLIRINFPTCTAYLVIFEKRTHSTFHACLLFLLFSLNFQPETEKTGRSQQQLNK